MRFPVKATNYGDAHKNDLEPELVAELEELTGAGIGPQTTGIVHLTPDLYSRFTYKNITKKIGYTIFETDRIPSHWVGPCNEMDEVWVPSQFNRETFVRSGVNKEKLRVIPYGVDTDFFAPLKETYPLPGRLGFVFLYVFIFDWRKGIDLLTEAYFNEFTLKDDTTLVLKVTSDRSGRGDLKKLIMEVIGERVDLMRNDLPHFVILDNTMDLYDLRRLYNTCDIYISTDRANGWGMPCMEAMAMGKPAATIDWSGSTEFMNESNSLLIRPTGRLISVDKRLAQDRPMYEGHMWAEVTVEEVRRVMRFAYENKDILREIAIRGRKDIREKYSLEAAANNIIGTVIADSKTDSKKRIQFHFSGKAAIKVKTKYWMKEKLYNFVTSKFRP